MAKVKPNDCIWCLEFYRYVCFSFLGNQTIFCWDTANFIFDLENLRSGHGQGQLSWSHLRPRLQRIGLLLVSWQSDHFWLSYSKFHTWFWKFEVKVMAKVKCDGHIQGLEFNQYVCSSFHGNWTIFGWVIGNSIFDHENSRSRSWPRSNPMTTFGA